MDKINRIYDQQIYYSNNEKLKNNNLTLPNICAFERCDVPSSYEPVQGSINIIKPTIRDLE